MDVHIDGTGNVLGRWDASGDYLLLCAHMDTVAPGTGIKPIVREGVVYSGEDTILGADDKSGIAVILEVLSALHAQGQHPPVEVALTVQEEVGLLGAKALDVQWLRAQQALVLDAGGPLNVLVYGAPVSDKIDAIVRGKAAHAGGNPEDGINAIAIAAQAIANMRLGRLDPETTANIGMIKGGEAVNVVPDRVDIRGEARSHDVQKLDAQIAAMRQALKDATSNAPGASVEIHVERSYEAYRLSLQDPLVDRITTALATMGQEAPEFRITGGGSDANVLNARGILAMPISTGMQAVHTHDEHVALTSMVHCAELLSLVLG
jgi:tripeptide aminopeptidase